MNTISAPIRWLIVFIAAVGFAFDIYELLMLPLVLPPAIREMATVSPNDQAAFQAYVAWWRAIMFYLPAVAGGIFGLLGGYLTDRLGRRRVLTWSILVYSVSAFLAGFSTSLPMLLVFRCTTFIGVCVEFVAAIAWLAELFDDPRQRERVLGYTQAFSSIGGLLVAFAFSLAIALSDQLPAITVPSWATSWWGSIGAGHDREPWRYTLMSGLIPALPLLLIRPFLPESPAWREKKEQGTLRRPSFGELFAPAYLRTTIVTTILFACAYGIAFGAIQQLPEIVPGLSDVKQTIADKSPPDARKHIQSVAADYTKMQEVGGLVGRFVLAFLAVRIVSRRRLLHVFQIPALIVVPLVFYFCLTMENRTYAVFSMPSFMVNGKSVSFGTLPVTTVSIGIFFAALFTVAQFSFWGNYLPRVYPLHLRGTGESFAANIGGRLFGTLFAAVTAGLTAIPWMPGQTMPERYAFASACVAFSLALVAVLVCFALPEPRPSDLPD
ncbi:MAG: MFS transporter [Gemmataceae bacterium]